MTDSLAGQFIISMPSLAESYFDQTVTYICEHDENGAFGIVINQQTDITFGDVVEDIDIDIPENHNAQLKIYIGGPVQQDRGFILHDTQSTWKSTLRVDDRIALTTSQDIIRAIALDEGPTRFIIALGYAGWSPGQLENEMLENAWLSCPADDRITFDLPAEERYKAAAGIIGVDMNTISSSSGHA